MDIKFVNKPNKDHNSLTSLVIDDVEYPLTERELRKTLRSFFDTRDDLFYADEFPIDLNYNQDNIDRIEELEDQLADAEERVDALEDEIEELRERLAQYSVEDY